jgi:hypothetical protein
MSTEIDSNPFPLGLIQPTPGSPLGLLQNYPDFDCPYVNMILVQSWFGNLGRCYIGNQRLNASTGEGLLYTLIAPGDVFVLGSTAQNVYRLAEFAVDVEVPGDQVQVSVYVR